MRTFAAVVLITLLASPHAASLTAPRNLGDADAVVTIDLATIAGLSRVPIDIEGDADFCGDPLSGVRNCATATGTCDDPYKIYDWMIEADPRNGLAALRIANTTKCVVVHDNFFLTPRKHSVPTVVLENVRNVRFENNQVLSGRATALSADGFRDGKFEGNLIQAGLNGGDRITLARIVDAPGLVLSGNHFEGLDGATSLVDALLELRDSDGATLSDNRFEGAEGAALRIVDSSAVTLTRETVKNALDAVVLDRATGTTIRELNVTGAANGVIALSSGTLVVRQSYLADDYPCDPACVNSVGLHAQATSLDVSNTTITGFIEGLNFDAREPHTLYGYCLTVTKNRVGILVDPGDDDDTPEDGFFRRIRQSSIVGNTEYGLRNVNTSNVHAENNWWGSDSGPAPNGTGDRVDGKVHFRPFLKAEPSC